MRIRTKLALVFSLLSFLIVAGLGIATLYIGDRAIERNISDQLLDINLLKEAELIRWVASNEHSLRLLAQRPLLREYTAQLISGALSEEEASEVRDELIGTHLSQVLEDTGGIVNLSILHADSGMILASTDRSLEGKFRENKPFFIEGKTTTYTGRAVYDLGSGTVVMHVSTPIVDVFGKLIGVLAGHVDLTEIAKIAAQGGGIALTKATYLVNQFNFLVTAPSVGENYEGSQAVYSDGVALALEGGTGVTFYDDYKGVRVLGAYHWIEQLEMAIITEVPVREAFASTAWLRNTFTLVACVTILLAITLSFVLARGITTRLEELSVGVREIASGNLAVRVGHAGRDEVGATGLAFNQMAEQLQTTTASRDELAEEIAHRKVAEENLRTSEEKHRLMFQNAPIGYQSLNAEGFILAVNDAWLEILGYDRSEVVGHWFGDFLHPDQQPVFKELFPINIQSREVIRDVEFTLKKADGEFIIGRYTARIGRDEHGDFERTHCVFEDVTERRQAVEAIRKSEALLVEAQAIAQVGSWDYSVEKNRSTWSREMFRIFGRPHELGELSWIEHQKYIHPDDWDRIDRAVQRAVKEGVDYREEFRLVHPNGETLWAETIGHVVRDASGSVVRLFGTVQDITLRKKAEAEKLVIEGQLRQAQKLESIGTLASGVAHEINNPLMGMMNYAELVKDGVPGDSRASELLDGILDEGNRIAVIVKNLLSFARQDASEHSPARVFDIVSSTLSLLEASMRKNQITLHVDVAEDLPQIPCRSQQIQQVIINLLTNAQDALNARYPEYDENKILSIVASTLRDDSGEWLQLTVEDHGTGIPQEIQARIYDPFFTSKSRDQGTGLGLSVSHGIIKDHGGRMGFETQESKFTRFYIDLPLSRTSASDGETKESDTST